MPVNNHGLLQLMYLPTCCLLFLPRLFDSTWLINLLSQQRTALNMSASLFVIYINLVLCSKEWWLHRTGQTVSRAGGHRWRRRDAPSWGNGFPRGSIYCIGQKTNPPPSSKLTLFLLAMRWCLLPLFPPFLLLYFPFSVFLCPIFLCLDTLFLSSHLIFSPTMTFADILLPRAYYQIHICSGIHPLSFPTSCPWTG